MWGFKLIGTSRHGPTDLSLPEDLGGVRDGDYRYCWLLTMAERARSDD